MRSAIATVPTTPSTGARMLSSSTWRCSSVDDRALALRQQVLVARVQAGALVLQAVVALARAPGRCRPSSARPARAATSICGDRAALEAALAALQVAHGGGAVDLGLVERLRAVERAQLRVERRAAGLGFQAGQRRLLLRQRLRSSGLSISASAWPFLTVSPACTFSVTVPAAGAYSVGLTAATTRPWTETSRTSVPRRTSAMRRRSALDRLAGAQPAAERGHGQGQQQRGADAAADQQLLAARADGGRGDDAVLSGGVADHAVEVFAGGARPLECRDRANGLTL